MESKLKKFTKSFFPRGGGGVWMVHIDTFTKLRGGKCGATMKYCNTLSLLCNFLKLLGTSEKKRGGGGGEEVEMQRLRRETSIVKYKNRTKI